MLNFLGLRSGGSGTSSPYVGFDDVLYVIRTKRSTYLISTLPTNEQDYLIQHTLSYQTEESVLNRLMSEYTALSHTLLVVYGRNGVDPTVETKYRQLVGLGFARVYMYKGGLLEWWMLQEVYGAENFPSQGTARDLLHYAAPPVLQGEPSVPPYPLLLR